MNTAAAIKWLAGVHDSQNAIIGYVTQQDKGIGERLRKCGSWLQIRECIKTGKARVVRSNYCKLGLLCRWCAIRRTARLIAKYAPRVETLRGCPPQLAHAVITLTVPNGSDLAETFTQLKKSWQKMNSAARKAKSNPRKNSPIEWNKVVGSLWSVEITKGHGGWHPHIHVYGILAEEVSEFHLSAEWSEFSLGAHMVSVNGSENGVRSGLKEVLKYATKFSQLAPPELWEVYRLLSGAHFVGAQGALRGLNLSELDKHSQFQDPSAYRDIFVVRSEGGYALKR